MKSCQEVHHMQEIRWWWWWNNISRDLICPLWSWNGYGIRGMLLMLLPLLLLLSCCCCYCCCCFCCYCRHCCCCFCYCCRYCCYCCCYWAYCSMPSRSTQHPSTTFDSTSEHNFHFHHVRLKSPSIAPLRSTQHLLALSSTTFMCCNTTVPTTYPTPQIAPNNEKCSYCSCCKIGDFFFSWRRFGNRWLSRECSLSMTTFCDIK